MTRRTDNGTSFWELLAWNLDFDSQRHRPRHIIIVQSRAVFVCFPRACSSLTMAPAVPSLCGIRNCIGNAVCEKEVMLRCDMHKHHKAGRIEAVFF